MSETTNLSALRRAANKARKFPANTCGASRYLHDLADELATGTITVVVDDPRGVAAHIYTVITALYEARDKARAALGE